LALAVREDRLSEYAEINLARRVVRKYQLSPPVDILELTGIYAKVEILRPPVDIDGVCINLKIPKKRPTIILNERRSPRRRRFTLAHELGHVLIPWHIGAIVDVIDLADGAGDSAYWELEAEANRFAAELLMPEEWVTGLIQGHENPCEMLDAIVESAEVSSDAALIKLTNTLSPGYIYASLDDDGIVVSSGRSNGTLANRLERGSHVSTGILFSASDQQWAAHHRNGMYLWWHFPNEIKLPSLPDAREWREILDNIVNELDNDPSDARRIKQTINAIVAYANSMITQKANLGSTSRTPEAVYAARMQRFNSRSQEDPMLYECVAHRDFPSYLSQRVRDLLKRG
jgi:Zn-dependent peptidase ImmA (M78 family)